MYKKPIIAVVDGMIEGVYAESGNAATCWSGDIYTSQDWNGSHHIFEARIYHSTEVEHISDAVTITMHFSSQVIAAYSENGWECSVSGMDVTVTRPSHANAYRSGDSVTFKVWVQGQDEALTKAIDGHITSFSCTKRANVQGGGAGGN